MADALLSPAVGGITAAGAAGLIAYSARRVTAEIDESKTPLMGVMGAFVFAAQMINFTIPATGSSGHLGGGMMLSIILGPFAAFLTIASVLVVQALLFADGGLLALGCNTLNLGLVPAFVCYPLLYRKIAPLGASSARTTAACMVSAIVALQLGAFAVVLETSLSGRSDLPFSTFLLLMQPIHLAIGVVEGLATAVVVSFVQRARPEVMVAAAQGTRIGPAPVRRLVLILAGMAVVAGGVMSWFASTHPDGLEWSLMRSAGQEQQVAPIGGVHEALARVQEQTAVMPDYSLGKVAEARTEAEPRWPAASASTSIAGLLGGALTLGLVVAIGLAVRAVSRNRAD